LARTARGIEYYFGQMATQPQPATSVCASCGRPLCGRFCPECGEERLDPHNLTVRHFLTHALHEVFELDGKIWRTLRGLVLRPGFLASEYCAGRRRLYANPFRLLITAAIVYALCTRGGLQVSMFVGPVALSVMPAAVKEGVSIADTVRQVDRFHLLGGLVKERAGSKEAESDAARERFHGRLEKFAEPLSFANVFLLALTLHALFWRRRGHFVEHGVFSMHFMSFVLFSGVLLSPVPGMLAAGWGGIVLPCILIILLWQFVYLIVGIRRFYYPDQTRGIRPKVIASSAALVVYLLNSVFVTGVQTLGAALALWMM
jgi:hypothetical protein